MVDTKMNSKNGLGGGHSMSGEPKSLFKAGPTKLSWHSLPIDRTFDEVLSRPEGLKDEEAEHRLKEFGPNVLPSEKPPSIVQIFLRQFLSPLIYVLMAAGIVALLLGDLLDAAFISIVLLINAIIGTFQESKAEKSAERLQQLLKITARIRRGGVEKMVPADDLVPGDIVLLESGNKVPADLRLISIKNLAMDESLLTGESVPSGKDLPTLPEDTTVGDRRNMAFAGTTVTTGRGVGVVVATGIRTELGDIAETVSTTVRSKPPLLIRLERFSRQVSYLVLAAAALLAVFAVVRGIPLVDVFFMAVALAVAAIPEGLPVAVTVALAIRVSKMAKKNVLTRRLAAVESLGSCTTIASDKTGTLTVNRQTVKALLLPSGTRLLVSGEGYSGEGEIREEDGSSLGDGNKDGIMEIVRAGILCNEATLSNSGGEWVSSGDAVDVALLSLGYKAGLKPEEVRSAFPTVAEIPFESEKRYAAKFYAQMEGIGIAVKGAVEVVLPLCERMLTEGGEVPIDRPALERRASALSSEGYRVLAVARGRSEREVPSGPDEEDIPSLTFLGLIGLIDPPRPGTREAVQKCACAGIRTVMITGDHPSTALTIARELGIASTDDQVVTGGELDEMGSPDVPAFLERVNRSRVFARVTPLQKLEIVDALIKQGHFVAVTGDGVNDAPALRKANIGVAMGSGTDVAKDASSIIVTDDNFATIVSGVEEGRYAYDNIRKVTYLLISTGVAEITLFLLAITLGVTDEEGVPILPLLAVQLLWLNVVTNGIQHVVLAMEGGDPAAMRRPPRRSDEGVFDRTMVQQVAVSAVTMGVIAFSVFYLLYEEFGYTAFAASNLTFLLMVLLENVHVFNCRSERRSAFKVPIRNNPYLLIGVLGAQGVQILAMYIPVTQEVLRIEPVPFTEWVILLGLALLLLVVMELFKLAKRRSYSEVECVEGAVR